MAIGTTSAGARTLKLLGAGARTLGRSLVKNLPGSGNPSERSFKYWTSVGADWVKTLGELRGAAMKLGQLASQYSDVLPPALAEQLRLLQRSVVPLPFAQVEPLLQQQWSAAQAALLQHIEPDAIAAASIGQVHRARLADGSAVVIKLLYPGVRAAVDADLSQLRRLIAAAKILPLDDSAMDRVMSEVRERFREETDYGAELAHLQKLRNTAATPGIVYATPRPELCTEGILVMSEEKGETLETAATWPQAERDALGQTLADWLAHSLFAARSVHADPHAGNFAFRRPGTVVVYDMGCVKDVPEAVVEQVRLLLNAVLRRDWAALHASLIALRGIKPEVSLAEVQPIYVDFSEAILLRLMATERFDFADAEFIETVRAVIRRHLLQSFKFQPVSELIFVMRAVGGMYWLLRSLGAEVSVPAVMARHGVVLPTLAA